MISILHMILDLIIEKRVNYVIDFLKFSDGFHIKNPEEFQYKWVIKSNGQIVFFLTFKDILFYEFLTDNRGDEKVAEKWKRKIKYEFENQKNLKNCCFDGLRITNENNEEKITLAFCI